MTNVRARKLIPKEHGAYGQLAFPVVSAFAAARPTPATAALVIATASAFLTHEPFLVAIGRRGSRARREDGARARRWIATCGGVAIASAGLGLALATPLVRELALVAAIPAALLGVCVVTGRERTLLGELTAVAAFAAAVLPIGASAGLSVAAATSVALVWLVGFGLATFVVRGVIAHARDASQGSRWRALVAAAVAAATTGWAIVGHAAMSIPIALAPFVVASAALAVFPPSPRKMHTVGWTLVATSVATLLVALRAAPAWPGG